MKKNILNAFSTDIGMDLGTCNTLVYLRDKGIVLKEPSVVAIERGTKRVVAVGLEAKRMLWRTPDKIITIRPLRDGVIADLDTTEKMIRHFCSKVIKKRFFIKPRMVIGIPSCITDVERRAVVESAMKAGARSVTLIEESLAAAIGAGMPIHEPVGNMVVDIGGGTTDIAIVSLGGLVVYESLRVGGDKFDESIVRYMRKQYNLAIGEQTAEDIKKQIGACDPKTASPEKTMDIRGRDLVQGLPRQVTVSSVDIARAIEEPVNAIVAGIKRVLEKTPPELSADVMDRGIILTGGGAYLRGIAELIMEETEINAMVAESAGECVALGTGIALESLDKLKETGAVYLATRKGIVNK